VPPPSLSLQVEQCGLTVWQALLSQGLVAESQASCDRSLQMVAEARAELASGVCAGGGGGGSEADERQPAGPVEIPTYATAMQCRCPASAPFPSARSHRPLAHPHPQQPATALRTTCCTAQSRGRPCGLLVSTTNAGSSAPRSTGTLCQCATVVPAGLTVEAQVFSPRGSESQRSVGHAADAC
jgi:hypothetical protein